MGNPLHSPTNPPKMSVNVALCGSIPRSCFTSRPPVPCGLQALSSHHNPPLEKGSSENKPPGLREWNRNIDTRPILSERQPLAQVCEAPTWAVPAKGETRLEPVCETLARQPSVDLTAKPLYRVGRSPHCDVQLVHGTSSRRHAMLFHHSNGSCYLVDCGSAHGTFVNGVRISSPSNGGVVVPHKVRRGAMIRFGGPGAPCFVLKSFSFKLKDIFREGGKKPDTGELVRRNTRLNALGPRTSDKVKDAQGPFLEDLSVCRKRSFDSLATSATLDEDERSCKRSRCSSPPLSPEANFLPLVSPDLVKRHVRFSADPPQIFYPALVTPEDSLSSEEDNESLA